MNVCRMGKYRLQYCPTVDMKSEILTKPLTRQRFEAILERLSFALLTKKGHVDNTSDDRSEDSMFPPGWGIYSWLWGPQTWILEGQDRNFASQPYISEQSAIATQFNLKPPTPGARHQNGNLLDKTLATSMLIPILTRAQIHHLTNDPINTQDLHLALSSGALSSSWCRPSPVPTVTADACGNTKHVYHPWRNKRVWVLHRLMFVLELPA